MTERKSILDRILDRLREPDLEDYEFDEELEDELMEDLQDESLPRWWMRRMRMLNQKILGDLPEDDVPSGDVPLARVSPVRRPKKVVQMDEKLPKKPSRENSSSKTDDAAAQDGGATKIRRADSRKMDGGAKEGDPSTLREILLSLIDSVQRILVGGEDVVTDSEIEVVRREAYYYMEENPNDKEFLITFAFSALDTYLSIPEKPHTDLYGVNKLMEMLVASRCEYEFLDLIKSEIKEACEGAYVGMTVTALSMMREIWDREAAKKVAEKAAKATETVEAVKAVEAAETVKATEDVETTETEKAAEAAETTEAAEDAAEKDS